MWQEHPSRPLGETAACSSSARARCCINSPRRLRGSGTRRDREHHRNPPRPLGAHQILHPGQLHAQNVAIEKQQRRQRLTLRSGRHLAPRRQFGQKRLALCPPHLHRMPLAVGQNEAPYP
ncbi:hypothetical protein A989_10280 [Xanthomonas translucens DAR61454]|nr:hypothetical protein A989_10280 [Xanthomonas translucens DAR61454]